MFVELVVNDDADPAPICRRYSLLYSSNSKGYKFFLRNEKDEGMSISEENLFDILDRYFKEEF